MVSRSCITKDNMTFVFVRLQNKLLLNSVAILKVSDRSVDQHERCKLHVEFMYKYAKVVTYKVSTCFIFWTSWLRFSVST